MLEKGLKTLLPALMAAGEIDRFAEMARWRIGESLTDLTPQWGHDCLVTERLIQETIGEALQEGWIERTGEGTRAELVVSQSYSSIGRRALFTAQPEEAEEVYRAGRMLANRLATSSKKWRSSDSESTSRSANPGRRLKDVVGR